jgi:FkbM family methyltransferase
MPLTIDGIELDIEDDPQGGVRHAVAGEITAVYHLDELTFEPGDIVIDVGAHVGIVSCYLAKKWPRITVYAIEPVTANYRRLLRNIAANGLTNVIALNYAITADGRPLELTGAPETNTGHYSAFAERGAHTETVPSLPLPAFFQQHGISHVALLKLDCEGAEHEILHGMRQELGKVHAIAMEVHENAALVHAYGSGAALVAFVRLNVPWARASVIQIPDQEEVSA